MTEYYFFWKHRLSQWHMVNFQLNGITYCCCEQAMMHQKALLFKDYDSTVRIMAVWNPAEHQRLGRHIKNFDQKIWDANKERIVYEVSKARYTQSAACRELLLSTGDALLVESSPYDCVWGIGLGKDDPKALDEKQWRGQNLLGKILTQVREEIKAQNG